MNRRKEESASRGMKPGPKEIRSKAQGTVPKAAFTNGEAGPFSKKYLSGKSIYERLQEDEVAHYILVNKSDGIIIYLANGSGSESMTSGSSYRSVMAVTDHRIVFALGGHEDTILEIKAQDVTGAEFQNSLLKKHVTVTAESKQYKFAVSTQESSDPEDAVEYIQGSLVPEMSTTEAGVKLDSSPTTVVENGSSVSPFFADMTLLSEDTRDALGEVTERLEAVNPSADDLQDAIEAYELIKENLEQTANEPGVSTETVDDELIQVERRLERLTQIHSAKIKANRKIVLAKNGMQVLQPTLWDLQASIEGAIEDAESLGRSTAELKKYRKKIIDRLDGATPGKTDRVETESSEGAGNTSVEYTENSESMPTDHPSKSETTEPSRSDLIEELQRLDEEIPREVKPVHVRKGSNYPASTYVQEFGSWEVMFKAAFEEESNQDTQGDSSIDSSPVSNGTNTGQEGGTQVEAEPTQETVVGAIEQTSEQLGKRPTTSEFSTHSSLNSSDAYTHFDSWGDALDAASLDTMSRQDLLDELHRLSTELGFPPLSSHVNEHSQFSAYDYRQVFGSVTEALEEAGLSVKNRVRATLREVVAENDGDPKMADFEAASDYSSGVIYKFFDSWDDAVSAVSPTETFSTKKGDQPSAGTKKVVQNELSERHELVRNLQKLCTAVLDIRQDQLDGEDVDSPMVRWADKVAKFWQGEATQNKGYRTQQTERNSFSIQEYREVFGDKDWVTEFECVQARQPSPTMRAIFGTLLDDDPSEIYLPVDEQNGDIFPVVVDTEDELKRSVKMLDRLPTQPASAGTDVSERPEDEGVDEDSSDTTTNSGELQEVNGVTDAIEQSLRESGFDTRGDLKNASLDDVAEVDGVSEQVAMRIKLDVGG